MGKRVHVELFDDFEPELPAETERELTVGGVTVHLDLSEKNARIFDKDMEKWLSVGTRPERGTGTGTRKPRKATHSGGEPGLPLADIRRWAKINGWDDIPDRGRVAAEVIRAWKAAGSPVGDDATKKAPAKKATAAAKKDAPEPAPAG